ncbi:MAG TPA: 2-dehydropantoate 2-reductase N-terminal domain-containing protein [Baekduia sp.]|uniref:ketopantoate reductase family protein n=1 Tax=Baekduia sp. TaxID=2600305 RepID=UPI002D1D910C|nr:2-dehydropantoate 2-reductase N-terminal domain-containing protein [Baekduia sp.]HMJ35973.1 2-dehydropantoate 2-reductase N-terminal domain-containing protein [Baekduia sp.]
MPDVAILGSGAVGALVGAALTRAGTDTIVITREPTVELLRRTGVLVESPLLGDGHVPLRAEARLGEPAGALLVAVKAPHLVAALERIEGEPDVVVPLLNGVDHMAVLRARFGERVVAGTARVQAHRESPTHVIHRAPFLTIAIAQPGTPALTRALAAAGIEVLDGGAERDVLWAKLSRLAGLALATAAADAPLGAVRPEAEAVAREVAAVADAEGAAIDAEQIVEELRGLPDGASSSLRADLAAGRPDHELDAIGGAVLHHAERHRLPAPRTGALVSRVARRAAAG